MVFTTLVKYSKKKGALEEHSLGVIIKLYAAFSVPAGQLSGYNKHLMKWVV